MTASNDHIGTLVNTTFSGFHQRRQELILAHRKERKEAERSGAAALEEYDYEYYCDETGERETDKRYDFTGEFIHVDESRGLFVCLRNDNLGISSMTGLIHSPLNQVSFLNVYAGPKRQLFVRGKPYIAERREIVRYVGDISFANGIWKWSGQYYEYSKSDKLPDNFLGEWEMTFGKSP